MLRNLVYFSISIILFFCGMVAYGIVLNLREDTLEESMRQKGLTSLSNVQLVISRNNYELNLYSDSILVKTYKAIFGQGTGRIKTSRFDNVTPRGNYQICSIDTNNYYYKKMFINYPNKKDAAEALRNNIITKAEYDIIVSSKTKCPSNQTRLGADIGIHGIGEYNFIFKNLPFAFNWTNGSIAVSNENIDEIISVVKVDTKVEIRD